MLTLSFIGPKVCLKLLPCNDPLAYYAKELITDVKSFYSTGRLDSTLHNFLKVNLLTHLDKLVHSTALGKLVHNYERVYRPN
jgi:hypothetical protein